MSSSSSAANSLRPAWHRGNPSGGGKGFSPPPTVATTSASERSRSHSIGSAGTGGSIGSGGMGGGGGEPRRDSNFNAFSALDDDDDIVAGAFEAGGSDTISAGGGLPDDSKLPQQQQPMRSSNSRSEALRAAATRSNNSSSNTAAGGGASSKGGSTTTGRSLADLAARAPEQHRSVSTGGGSGGRFSNLRSSDSFGESTSTGGVGASATASSTTAYTEGPKVVVVRYTRERLLSMRPAPSSCLPESLKELIGAVILSESPQDPVCWDSFDAEEIWAAVPRASRAPPPGMKPGGAPGLEGGLGAGGVGGAGGGISGGGPGGAGAGGGGDLRPRVRSMGSNTGGRWQRGVALPPPDQAKKGTGRDKDAESPNELWDDPKSAGTAASDFSAFGAMPPEDGEEVFNFEKMTEATRKFQEEMHSSFRSRASSDACSEPQQPEEPLSPASAAAAAAAIAAAHSVKIDPKRPLATIGTTIQSGSGDEVNVFEDFGDPGSEEEESNKAAAAAAAASEAGIRGGTEDPSASSRLMAMIGVNREETSNLSGIQQEPSEPAPAAAAAGAPAEEPPKLSGPSAGGGGVAGVVNLSPWGGTTTDSRSAALEGSAISMNPWGAPSLIPTPSVEGLTIQAQLRGAAELEEQKRQTDELRRRQEQEEAQRRLQQQKQDDEERARQQAALQQQQQQQQQAAAAAAGVQSQVELVLLERISSILENSWGRSDLISILNTLHAEDPRVIPLLSTVDALRALIMRHPRRVAFRHDPSVGAELAILVTTNAQWQQQQQQQQQQEAQARAQMEEMRLREQQRRQMEEQQQRAAAQAAQQQAAAAAAHAAAQQQQLSPSAPWYYSDPQNNIQGPFRGNEMRQWLEAGYFKGDLPISQQPNGPFRPLSSLFPNLAVAFLPTTNDSATAAAAAAREAAEEQERLDAERARAEAEALAKQQQEAAEREMRAREAAARAEHERLLAAEEAERAKREAAEKATAANSANGGNESSAQLRMMLGLSSQGAAAAAGAPPVPIEKKQEAAPTSKSKSKAAAKNSTVQQQQRPPEAPKPPALLPSVSAPPSSPWGGATQQAIQRKSMSEIQKEEARATAMLAMQQQGSRPGNTSGWANVAASRPSGSTAWTGAPGARAATTGTATVPTATTTNPALASATSAAVASRPRQASVGAVPTKNRPMTKDAGASAAEEFGAKMTPAMEKWCKDQMTKLNGSDDLTLVSFCMTLGDPLEIRQYLTAYLGSTPQVNSFATEFINKRGLGSGATKQEEWETTATAKKARKGKKK